MRYHVLIQDTLLVLYDNIFGFYIILPILCGWKSLECQILGMATNGKYGIIKKLERFLKFEWKSHIFVEIN